LSTVLSATLALAVGIDTAASRLRSPKRTEGEAKEFARTVIERADAWKEMVQDERVRYQKELRSREEKLGRSFFEWTAEERASTRSATSTETIKTAKTSRRYTADLVGACPGGEFVVVEGRRSV
jgi:hypothetical protein